jgi:uncharacterized membrane protein required for colicin V production
MGLDVALGIVILIAAFRGWLQGFTYQVIRIGGLIACVYLAAVVRDRVKPSVLPYLPSIPPEKVDRLLWWVSASLTYFVIVAAATLALKMTRRPEIPGIPPQRARNDQFAGFLLGVAKGGLVAVFLVAGLEYGLKQIKTVPWADEQARSSLAMQWNDRYHPGLTIWNSVPVRHFANHFWHMALENPSPTAPPDATKKAEDRPTVQTAKKGAGEGSRGVTAPGDSGSVPPAPPAPNVPKAGSTDPELDQAVEEIKGALDAASKPNSR